MTPLRGGWTGPMRTGRDVPPPRRTDRTRGAGAAVLKPRGPGADKKDGTLRRNRRHPPWRIDAAGAGSPRRSSVPPPAGAPRAGLREHAEHAAPGAGPAGAPNTGPSYTAGMPALRRAAAAGSLGLALIAAAAPARTGDALYVCADPADTRVVDIGATLCDAAPTDALAARREPDNLQLRAGALVTAVSAGGVAQAAGLQAGDVIYRVGGVDVEDNVETTARLSLIGDAADTVVNFLRGGRPYLVRLRRP